MTRALSGGSLHLNPGVYPYPSRVYQGSLGRRTAGKRRRRRRREEEKMEEDEEKEELWEVDEEGGGGEL